MEHFACVLTVQDYRAQAAVLCAGMASIATLPISLICASIFSEVAWARCWAAASDKVLKRGATYGMLQVRPALTRVASVII